MVSCQTKNPNLGKFSRAFEWKKVGKFFGHFEYNTAFGAFYGNLVI
jgi:hypothetical protein